MVILIEAIKKQSLISIRNGLMQLDNLKSLADCAPLKTPLVLGNHSIKSVTVYNDMNVML